MAAPSSAAGLAVPQDRVDDPDHLARRGLEGGLVGHAAGAAGPEAAPGRLLEFWRDPQLKTGRFLRRRLPPRAAEQPLTEVPDLRSAGTTPQ